MDINTIFAKIKESGHIHSKIDELREYCNQNLLQILKHLPRRILNADGGDLIGCILKGLPEDTSSSRNKVKVIDLVLQVMRKQSTSLTHCADIISRLCLEFPRLPAEDLVGWCNDSLQSIVVDSDVNMIWRDIIPECMNALSSYDVIKHSDTEMSFGEYKAQCVDTLCECQWRERQYVQITAMFKDLQLNRNDHKQVVNKICSYILDIDVESLPPLVHQLLKLCKLYDLEIVLSHLSNYFSVRLYGKLEPPQDSESTTMDVDDIVPHNPAELSRCLSTCIYHITQGAAEPELVRKHIKAWPKTQMLRAPFIIDVVLAMSNKGAEFQSVCLEAIRSTIEQREMDILMSKESAVMRSVLPPDVDIVSVLKALTTESANHRQLTVVGLINLAFLLLSMVRTKPVARACWSHGKLILVRLCKSQPETTAHILSQLADRLAGNCDQRQYAECLYVLCKLTPVSLEGCTQLGIILENCQSSSPSDYRDAAAVLDAVHPLLNFSMRTRDTLVMVCRKGLHSRDSSHRCLALSGFLTVLKYIKLSRTVLTSSQSVCSDQYSTHSYLTQVAVDMHATQQGTVVKSRVRNESMCMEVVSILRRCLTQDAQVRELLYSNIYDCAEGKPILFESLLDLFYEHLSKYLSEACTESPLLIDKCIQLTPTSAVLLEPISRLLYAVSQFLQPADEEDLEDILTNNSTETGSTHFKNKLYSILEKLCTNKHIGNIDMEDISLTDLTPESKAKCLYVQQTLLCYEVLIAHQIRQWTLSSDDVANSVYKLYKDCEQLMEKMKTPSKNGKKRPKTLNDTRDTVQTQKTQKSQKDKGKSPSKFSNLVKERAGPFKPLPCLWDLRLCVRVAELLYSAEVPWSSVEQRNQLRSKHDFHDWALRCILSVLSNKNIDKRSVATYVVKLARIMYTRCICRFQHMWDFNDQTALGCVDVFRACLNLLFSTSYSLKLGFFLPTITGLVESKSSVCIAAMLEHIHSSLQRVEEETGEGEKDAVVKKLVISLIQTATVLLEVGTPSCVEMNTVIAKFEDYVRKSKRDVLPLIPPVLTAVCREQQEMQLLDDLLQKLISELGRNDEETSSAEDVDMFPTIDSRSGHAVLSHICGHLTDRFRFVEHLLARTKDKQTAILTQTVISTHKDRIDRELKEMYKYIVIQLCQLTSWTSDVGKLRCCIGTGSDKVLGVCLRLYTLLAALAKQIDVATALHVRFERLLKLSGKKLSSVTDNLITYLESSQQQQKASKVLRETKLIPRLVCQAEQYSKNVTLLANKAKLNWQQYLSLGTARDFKIKAPVLQEVLKTRDKVDEVDEDDAVVVEMENDVSTNGESSKEESAGDSEEESPFCRA